MSPVALIMHINFLPPIKMNAVLGSVGTLNAVWDMIKTRVRVSRLDNYGI